MYMRLVEMYVTGTKRRRRPFKVNSKYHGLCKFQWIYNIFISVIFFNNADNISNFK